MEKLLKGYAYDLEKLIRIEGYHGFLLRSDRERPDKEPGNYDLGKRRILNLYSSEAYLILVGRDQIISVKIEPGSKISDVLKKMGYKCRVIAEYGGHVGRDGKRTGYSWETWKMAVRERRAIFSENGYALQYRAWLDYWFYQFELRILKKGWIMIEDHDIAAFHFDNVTEDIMDRGRSLIEKALEKEWNLSGRELENLLGKYCLESDIDYLWMAKRQ